MDGVDPDTLLEWLQTGGIGEERDLQLMALEQLCMLLLMSDNIDRCFESCPPRTFLPALCRIFLDETAPENVLEVTSRAITYYLDVSNECTRRIIQVEGAVKAICDRLYVAEMTDRTSKDLAEQCVKLLEHVCQRETTSVYDAGDLVHKDTLYSAMSVVQRLCSRVEPNNTHLKECTIDLGELLQHEDQKVAESALRCFAALTDRYIRKMMNPSELAESSNLVEHLLNSLIPDTGQADSTLNESNVSVYGSKSASFISIVLSLLSNLCRGSSQITLTVVSSPKLIPALKAALSNRDERCVLDSLRLADLLVILLCEGRQAFSRSNVVSSVVGGDEGTARMSYDRTHRYLIDIIRQRDTNALIEAVESGNVDPNFIDDVGQTLLNWCSAFGTIEMVTYLCEKGADVNCGQRSSSLHYAACFGRVDVIIALLQNGANPDLRDEDGRTALEKARERSDESHQQVIQILESPSDYMMLARKRTCLQKQSRPQEIMDTCEEKQSEEQDQLYKIDPVITRNVIQQLIPIFCTVFNDSMVASVRRATLSLIKKCIQYCPADAFEELVLGKAEIVDGSDDENSVRFVERLMKVVVSIFNEEGNLEGHMQVIMILKSLFEKDAQFWLDQLNRLGIIEKVEQLASSKNAEELRADEFVQSIKMDTIGTHGDIFSQEPMDVSPAPSAASGILRGERSPTFTPSIGLLSSESVSSKSQTSGGTTPDGHSQSNRTRMLNVPIQVDEEMISDTETPPPTNEQQQIDVSTLMDTSDSSSARPLTVGSAPVPLTSKSTAILPQKRSASLSEEAETKRQKVFELAKDLWDTYLKEAHNKPREVFVQLRTAAIELKECVEVCARDQENFSTEEALTQKLIRVRDLIVNENLLSTFELVSSGLIPALLALVHEACAARQGVVFQVFYKVFDDEAALSSIVRRIVQVLEFTEKFKQNLYDTPGGSAFGLQLLSRRLRFTMQQHNPKNDRQSQLLNRTGRVLKTEPLTTIGQLRSFLHRMVSKMWYDYPRDSIFFVKELKAATDKQQTVRLQYESDFDTNGLMWFLGTNSYTTDWTNPAAVNLVQILSFDGQKIPYGSLEDILSRDVAPMNCHSSDSKDAYFTIDLGVYIKPNAYTLRHARGYGKSALRTWDLEGSEDNKTYFLLKRHVNDKSLNEPGSTATFHIDETAKDKKIRFVRIQQRGYNASEMTHYLSLSGFEIYGEIVDVVTDSLTITETTKSGSSSGSNTRAMRLQQQVFPPRPNGSDIIRVGKDGKAKKASSSSSGSKAGTIRLRKAGANNSGGSVIPPPSINYSNPSQFPISLNTFVRFFESSSAAMEESGPNSSTFESAFGSGYPARQRIRASIRNPQSFAMNPATVAQAHSMHPSAAQNPQTLPTQKSMSTNNLQDSEQSTENDRLSVAATKQASSAETIGQLREPSPSLENLLSRARLFVGTTTGGLSQDRIPESVPENDALTDYESSLDAHSNHDLDSNQTLDDVGEPNASSRHLSVSTPEDGETYRVDNEGGGGSASQQHLFGFSDYQEILRSGNIDSIEDVEFERAILSNCIPGDEILDEDEMDSYASDDHVCAPIPVPSSSTNVSSSGATPTTALQSTAELLAFIDESSAAAITSNTGPSLNTAMAGSNIPSRVMRHEIIQLLTEAAERHSAASVGLEIPTGASSNTVLPHEVVLSMLDAAGIRTDSGEHISSTALHHQNRSNTGGRNQRKPTRQWDDEYVLRRQYNSLLPAFDPRPGRSNVNQTQDVELPPETNIDERFEPRRKKSHSRTPTSSTNLPLNLYLSGPNMSGVTNQTIPLNEDDETVFSAVQRLFGYSALATNSEKSRKIWEPTYTIVYVESQSDSHHSSSDQIQCVTSSGDVNNIMDPKNVNVKQTLDTLKYLHELAGDHSSTVSFISPKLTQKLHLALNDPLIVASGSLPKWCETLIYNYHCLFSLDTRNNFLRATAFGTSRAIVWLQNRRDQMLEEARGTGPSQSSASGARREDHYPEFRIGRIKHERIKVERSEEVLFENALRVLKYHASRKSVLEIEFTGEEGIGLGPTLEFYALVAAEFQRKSLGIWLCDDSDEQQQKLEADSLDLGEGVKPPGYYVRRSGGLFPAPVPQESEEATRMSNLFRMLGVFLAKVLQDNRLVDLPLSLPFLRLLISDSVAGQNDDLSKVSLDGLLGLADLDEIHQHKARFLRAVQRVCIEKSRIRNSAHLSATEKAAQINALCLKFNDGHGQNEHECRVEDLELTFVINPSSTVFNYSEYELIPNGSNIGVTIDNIELYLGKCVDFYLNSGIRQQITAFREGFDSVFPLRSLKTFSATELQTLLSGEQCPEWTKEDLLNFTEPKLGYTRDSPGFLRFVDVVSQMSANERKAFLQFTTGCSSLPPGGLANLHPRLTIVRKVDAGGNGSYPSVNTCVHYLKLPEYSSSEILRERLLAATCEKGFHLA